MSDSLLHRKLKELGAARIAECIPPAAYQQLLSLWPAFARPEQLEPDGDWRTWLILAGRGWGKSRVGAETIRKWAMQYPGCHIALVGRTAADVRDVMVRAIMTPWRGGILDPEGLPLALPSMRSLVWKNGSRATTYSAEEPNQLRGPQHDFCWADELAAWPSSMTKARSRGDVGGRSAMEEMWYEGVIAGMRGSGECKVAIPQTRIIVTTTPRPKQLIRDLIKDTATHVTRGSTYENSENLPPEHIRALHAQYDGTRMGRQEIDAELLDDVAGAFWTHAMIDDNRVAYGHAPDLVRVTVGVDPSGKSKDGDEQGIVVVGKGTDGHCYVLADRSTTDTPDGWGRRAVKAYQDFQADRIVGERNYGGDMVGFVVEAAAKDMGVRVVYRDVQATRGKAVRAEPVSALYEQGRVHHVGDDMGILEEQMRMFVPESGRSPDRMDALVWAVTDLMLGEANATIMNVDWKGPGFTFGGNDSTDDDD